MPLALAPRTSARASRGSAGCGSAHPGRSHCTSDGTEEVALPQGSKTYKLLLGLRAMGFPWGFSKFRGPSVGGMSGTRFLSKLHTLTRYIINGDYVAEC